MKNQPNTTKQQQNLSKFISLVLRHQPDAAYVTLDEHGWANVEQNGQTD